MPVVLPQEWESVRRRWSTSSVDDDKRKSIACQDHGSIVVVVIVVVVIAGLLLLLLLLLDGDGREETGSKSAESTEDRVNDGEIPRKSPVHEQVREEGEKDGSDESEHTQEEAQG